MCHALQSVVRDCVSFRKNHPVLRPVPLDAAELIKVGIIVLD